MYFYVLAALAIDADQLTKWWVRFHLSIGESSRVLDGIIPIIRVENTGAAGSSFEGHGRWFVPFAVLIVAVVLYFRSKGKLRGRWMETGTAFYVGGAVGNAIDRALSGRVTDFIQLRLHGGVMNVADISLNVGIVILLLAVLFERPGRSSAPAARTH
ncbi:signal peptidase II [Paenibacillus humicola]|uniref:signal peptidase II n=1 Tax=Paenibacillus humicola TaxID=3110540 RepID=UPI00237B5718|nr:signal peptidase II [Paenibacillus humicola]